MRRVQLAFELLSQKSDSGDFQPPAEFRIIPKGAVETTKGVFLLDDEGARAVMSKAASYKNDYCIDYNHAALGSFFEAPSAEQGKAAGWFKPAMRDDGLWATEVSWTGSGSEYLKKREYRYFSPTLQLDEEGRVCELVNVALTNIPAMKGMQPLVASRAGEIPVHTEERPMKTLLIALGLADTATEAEAVAALARLQDGGKQLLALTGKSSLSEALGVAVAWKQADEQVKTLTARLSALETEKATHEIDELVAKGKKEGKVPPAMEAFCREMGQKDLVMLRSFLEKAVPVVGAPAKAPAVGDPSDATLNEHDLEILSKTGTDPKKFLAEKARLLKAGQIVAA